MGETEQCYLCYGEESAEKPFALDPKPCDCTGSIVLHIGCLQQLLMYSKNCSICKKNYNITCLNLYFKNKQKFDGFIIEHINGIKYGIKYRIKYKFKVNDAGQKHGPYEQYYIVGERGHVKKCYYVNGKIEGLYEIWDWEQDITNIRLRCNYINDKIEGLCEEWNENGQKYKKYYYVNGKIEGLSEEWQYDEQKYSKCYYINGRMEGVFVIWYLQEDIKNIRQRFNCINGKREGLCEEWHENGKLHKKYYYLNGKIEGLYEEWYDSGELCKRCNYKNDKIDGLCEVKIEKSLLQRLKDIFGIRPTYNKLKES